MMECNYIEAGKTRGGRTLYYCTTHSYYTTDPTKPCPGYWIDKYSRHLPETTIDIADYPGGIGVWGSLPPIIDTTKGSPLVLGVHLHARKVPDGPKQIDATYRKVTLLYEGRKLIDIDADTAVNYTLSTVAGFTPRLITCNHCGALHTDKGALAVIPHKVHLCHSCKRKFRKKERAIGNRLAVLRRLVPQYYRNRRRVVPNRSIEIDMSREMRIWASNPAILWTAPRPEEEGIHIHLYEKGKKVIDETYGRVIINGREIDPESTRILMAQKTYSLLVENILDKIQTITCPRCGKSVLYKMEKAFTPTRKIICPNCGHIFYVKRAIIPQPLAWLVKESES